MAIDAQEALTASFVEYGVKPDMSSVLCEDVGGSDISNLPDMCMPDEQYQGEVRKQDVDENGDPQGKYYAVNYDDTRPKGGKNHPKYLSPNEKFANVRTGDYLGYKIQPKTPSNQKVHTEMCASKTAGTAFSLNAKGDTKYGKLAATTSWQYFGGQYTGMFAQYPASIQSQCWCDTYDPRYRPWYTAAVTGPKDMILVLDSSGSMRDKVKVKKFNDNWEEVEELVERLDIMKEAAIAQLDTITFSDFVQVVRYSDSAISMGTKLIRGTKENKDALKKYIKELKASGTTCGKCGFEKALKIFKDSINDALGDVMQETSGCERIISFLTDGKMNNNDWASNWMDSKLSELGGKKPHVFSYALGSGADTEIPAQLACKNQGWFAKIEDNDPAALKHAMVRYFEYFAGKIPADDSSSIPRWTEFYMDSAGQGKMTTVALPVYAPFQNKRVFRGVVGIDVIAKDFGASLDDSALARALQKRSGQCVAYNFDLPEDPLLVSKYTSATQGDLGACVIKTTNAQDSGTFIPTGATIHKVPDGFCSRGGGWIATNLGWIILAVVILAFCCFLAILFRCWKKRRFKASNKTVHPQQQQVEMAQLPQQQGQGNYYQQPQQQHQQTINMHQQQQMMMLQQQSGGSTGMIPVATAPPMWMPPAYDAAYNQHPI